MWNFRIEYDAYAPNGDLVVEERFAVIVSAQDIDLAEEKADELVPKNNGFRYEWRGSQTIIRIE